jgi:hypothetical protein
MSAKKYLPRHQELDPQVDHIIRVFRACEIAATYMTIKVSWEKAGFVFVRRNDTYYLWVNEDKIRRSSEFQEVWQRLSRGAVVSTKTIEKWGWLN